MEAFDDFAGAALETSGFQGLRHDLLRNGMSLQRSLRSALLSNRFPTAYVPNMFYFDSAFKAIEMRIATKGIGLCAACFIVLVSDRGAAQQPDDASQDAASAQAGVRIAIQSNGFQLVEHGIWSRDIPTLQGARSNEVASPSLTTLQQTRAYKHRPSGFRRAGYLPHIYAAEAQFALPPGLLDALVWTESRYNPFAISKAGAVGLGQLMPGTARDMGVTNRYDPQANILGAARYLRQMIDKFRVVHLALAAYNAGPRAVERAGGIPRNGETPAYVRNVLQSWHF